MTKSSGINLPNWFTVRHFGSIPFIKFHLVFYKGATEAHYVQNNCSKLCDFSKLTLHISAYTWEEFCVSCNKMESANLVKCWARSSYLAFVQRSSVKENIIMTEFYYRLILQRNYALKTVIQLQDKCPSVLHCSQLSHQTLQL